LAYELGPEARSQHGVQDRPPTSPICKSETKPLRKQPKISHPVVRHQVPVYVHAVPCRVSNRPKPLHQTRICLKEKHFLPDFLPDWSYKSLTAEILVCVPMDARRGSVPYHTVNATSQGLKYWPRKLTRRCLISSRHVCWVTRTRMIHGRTG
jgi:hypothetical protein